MKLLVNFARICVGVLFIFSGLVKANDPLGLSYKMQEFFEVWALNPGFKNTMDWLHNYALSFSIIMITLEIVVGVGILLGIWKRFFSFFLLLLIIFFSFLTGYAVFSGKIATCGCFGDCIPLTAMQSFIKDMILLVLILVIFLGVRYIKPVGTIAANTVILFMASCMVLAFQWYVLRHLPVIDCLPFKKGNNILALRKMPADAVPDKKDYIFTYKKNGTEQKFKRDAIPDSTWEFVNREDVIIEKGKNNEPPVKDFYLTTLDGNDSTDALLSYTPQYYLLFIKDIPEKTETWYSFFEALMKKANNVHAPVYVITSQVSAATTFFNELHKNNLQVLSLDATSLKTAARTNPALYMMNGPVVADKWGWADFKDALK